MIRTQIQLESEQYERLRRLAAARAQSLAELVREGVDHVLEQAERGGQWDALWQAAGSCRDVNDQADVAEHHDRYLAELLRP